MADAYTRPYGDATSSSFPKMGENPMVGTLVNVSGDRSSYTHPRGKGGPSGDSETEPSSVRLVGSTATGENAGPRFAPVTTIYYPNTPEASQTGRGLRTVPSAIGNRDFWDSRYETGTAY